MTSEATTSPRGLSRTTAVVAVLALVMTAGGLVIYKAAGALKVLGVAVAVGWLVLALA